MSEPAIHIIRYVEFTSNAGWIHQCKTAYLLIPKGVVKKLLADFNINLTEKNKNYNITCDLVVEKQDNISTPKLSFTITPKKKKQIKEKILEIQPH